MSSARILHARIGAFYLSQSPTEAPATFEALLPSIEAVYHLCRAGEYYTAAATLHDKVYFGNLRTLVDRFGAYDSAIDILEQFCRDSNVEQDLLVEDPRYRAWIFDELALSFMSLGRLNLPKPFLAREIAVATERGTLSTISRAYQNLAEVLSYSGELANAERAADSALASARDGSVAWYECFSLCRKAWPILQQQRIDEASELYRQADEIQVRLDGFHLYHQRGIEWAMALCRRGEYDRARDLTTINLDMATTYQWTKIISQCHRMLGDLDSREGDSNGAQAHYDDALARSRRAAHLPTLIEALLAWGRWTAARGHSAGRAALEEALTYAVEGEYAARGDVLLRYAHAGGYRIYEADIRIALGTVLAASGDILAARTEISRAREISRTCQYGWGITDADAAIATLRG
jgi:tetratricopeptide (TPR) repeat protein